MPLLNYRTRVSADQTAQEVAKLLAKAGARAIMQEYDENQNITGISFRLKLEEGDASFSLPTDWHPVQQVLKRQGVASTEQVARNVAWRIVKDWVEAQLAIIETQMVTTAQVFLPYMLTAGGESMYEYVGKHTSLLLGDGK